MATSNSTFTDKYLKALQPASNNIRFRDGIPDPSLKGFGITVLRNGRKVFFLNYTSPETGKRRFMGLGTYPGVSLSAARKKARQQRETVGQGIDPVEEEVRQKEAKRAKQQAQDARGTVEQLFDIYIRDLEMDQKRVPPQVRNIYERDIHHAIGHLYASEITEDQCADIIATVADRGALTLANRTRTYLRAAFGFGKTAHKQPRWRKKGIPEFGIKFNPAAETERALKQDKVGERNLSRQEVKTLWHSMSVDAMKASQATAIKFLLATGQRVEEVLGATWDEFDREENLWTIPGSRRKTRHKTTEPHLVPLTDFHWQLLDEIRQYSGKSKFLFPHRDGSNPRPAGSLAQALRRFCKPPKGKRMEPFAPRDLRRTWKTLAGSMGLDLEIRNRIQGHGMTDVGSKHFDRWSYLPEKRTAMKRWIGWLETVISDQPNVVPMEKRNGY